MRRWLPFAPLVVLAILGVLFAGYALRHDPQVLPDARVGQPVPAVSLPLLEGGDPTPLKAALQGPVLINLFASWCAPCAIEHPELMRLKAQGVRIIGIAYKDDPDNARRFLQRLGNPYDTVLVDRSGDAGIEFGASGVPETYAVDAAGRIVAKYGPMTSRDADAAAARLKVGR
jgi:cytochrome c biogenesis protein CcmG/thiol:disulfide interchange protein DsbE